MELISLSDDLDDPEKTANALKKTIDNSVNDLEKTNSDLTSIINNKKEDFRSEVMETNIKLTKVEEDLKSDSENIQVEIDNKVKSIRDDVSNFERDVWIITGVASLLYIIYLIFTQTAINLTTLVPLVLTIIIGVLVGYWARVEKTVWFDDVLTINQYLTNIFSKIYSIPRLKSHENFEGVEQGLRNVTNISKRLLTATKEYNPVLKAAYAQATLDFQLRTFITTMFGAIHSYGIEIDSGSEKVLNSFHSLANTDDEWVSELTAELSKTLKIKSLTLSLLYYTYVDNTARAQTAWQKLKDKEELLELAKILIKDFQRNNLGAKDNKFVLLYAKLLKSQPTFDLSSFNSIFSNLYSELQSLINVINPTLTNFGFKINDTQRKKFIDFVPSGVNPGEWVDEFLLYVSNIINQDKEVIAFLVEENTGDIINAQKTFAKIKAKESLRKDFLTLLIVNKVLSVPQKYSTASVIGVISNKLLNEPIVSISTINTKVNTYFSDLESNKQKTLEALSSYNIKISNALKAEFVNTYISENVSSEDMLIFFSKGLNIDSDFLKMFYYEFVQDNVALQKKYLEVINQKKDKELANLLLNLKLIETTHDDEEMEEEDLASILRVLKSFKLITIQSYYQSYRNLLIWTRNLYSYCIENKLADNSDNVDLNYLLTLLKDEESQNPYKQLYNICLDIISKAKFQPNNKEVINSISLSTLVLFFQSNTDYRLRESCIEASSNPLAQKIIYNFIVTNGEAGVRGNKPILKDIITTTMTDSSLKYPYIEDMKGVLSQGLVPRQISDMVTVRFENKLKLLSDIEKKNYNVTKTFNDIKTSLHKFFESQLEEDVVLELLRMQVISAYLITIPSTKPVIGEILSDLMPRIAIEYASKRVEFKNMLMMEKGGGRYTRIGIVPIGQSFENFSRGFNELFHEAVYRYCKSHTGEDPTDFSANLIRIFPIEASFKVVKGAAVEGPNVNNPASTIRNLFLDNLSNETNLALVATARANDPEKVALKHVVIDLFDQFATLWSILEPNISTIIGNRKSLETLIKDPEFDKEFLSAFDSSTITKLAEKIYLLSTIQKHKQDTKAIIQKQVVTAVKKSNSRMSQNEQDTLSNEIFEKLNSIGMILNLQ